ncbi:hypothetical protein [Halalkalicoccus salilacus]|uniref:hypothetical protein n=1 Tax=Halalkalicoccus TaxID=332246 RepID=UPI002F96CCB1
MATIPIQTQARATEHVIYPELVAVPSREVRVGATPVARYASWSDHRHQIRQAAEQARAGRLARRAS